MDVSSIAAVASNLAATTTSQAVSVAVLKKALATQSETAAALLQAIPAPLQLPDHLGQRINTVA